ncbi:MAG: hypothetical protein ACRCYN_08965 [Plesiomonas sp.]
MQQLTLSTYVADEAKDLKSKKYQTRRKKKEERRKKKILGDTDSSNTTIEYTEHWHKKNADIISAPQKYIFAI